MSLHDESLDETMSRRPFLEMINAYVQQTDGQYNSE
jgi:hypothetical protein